MAKVAFWFVESTVARIVGGALSDLLLPHQAGRKEPLQSPLAAGYTTLGCLSGNHITDGKGLSAATAPDNETRTSLTPAALVPDSRAATAPASATPVSDDQRQTEFAPVDCKDQPGEQLNGAVAARLSG
eukprot:CAMPEP_0117679710 /NCGR_PEP_ID=MMETSP0804-20121206/17956_1 /TAXON_ID=1074897 /ORGANISM="Tetraselmis astigmatica, Strain CCMP880" /LENGTH=128 /DNA_ID=CAMNT_0005489143 /DNA_START=620 /DNA_END=1004 /DNA_ORIENTATION=+